MFHRRLFRRLALRVRIVGALMLVALAQAMLGVAAAMIRFDCLCIVASFALACGRRCSASCASLQLRLALHALKTVVGAHRQVASAALRLNAFYRRALEWCLDRSYLAWGMVKAAVASAAEPAVPAAPTLPVAPAEDCPVQWPLKKKNRAAQAARVTEQLRRAEEDGPFSSPPAPFWSLSSCPMALGAHTLCPT